MALHGVDATDKIKMGNMKFLSEQMRQAERILNF